MKMHVVIRYPLALVFFCMVMLSLSPAHAVTQDEVIIGLNLPLSGPYVLQGKDQLNSYALAKEEIDAAGGILGKKIKFLIADSKSDPKVSVENVKKFIAEGVDMVTGGSSSASLMMVWTSSTLSGSGSSAEIVVEAWAVTLSRAAW